ncbi:hypothetical protein AB4401_12085, partial [Vibrio cyclitrophicus]
NTLDVINLLKPYLLSINVKYIKLNNDARLRHRLMVRGHARLKFINVDDFILLNRNVENTLLDVYPNACFNFEVIDNA